MTLNEPNKSTPTYCRAFADCWLRFTTSGLLVLIISWIVLLVLIIVLGIFAPKRSVCHSGNDRRNCIKLPGAAYLCSREQKQEVAAPDIILSTVDKIIDNPSPVFRQVFPWFAIWLIVLVSSKRQTRVPSMSDN